MRPLTFFKVKALQSLFISTKLTNFSQNAQIWLIKALGPQYLLTIISVPLICGTKTSKAVLKHFVHYLYTSNYINGGGVLVFHLLHNKCKICCSYAFSVIINIVHVQEIFAKFEITEYGRFFVIQISKLGRVKVHVYIIWLRFRFVWPLVKVNLKDIFLCIWMTLHDYCHDGRDIVYNPGFLP